MRYRPTEIRERETTLSHSCTRECGMDADSDCGKTKMFCRKGFPATTVSLEPPPPRILRDACTLGSRGCCATCIVSTMHSPLHRGQARPILSHRQRPHFHIRQAPRISMSLQPAESVQGQGRSQEKASRRARGKKRLPARRWQAATPRFWLPCPRAQRNRFCRSS